MATLFISDVHLSAERPAIVAAFVAFLGDAARRADALYVLGDLFDEWLGDDDHRPPHPEVVTALRGLCDAGVPVNVMHGNHDFLLGGGFEAATHCRLIPDPTIAELYGTRALLMHGDSMCTRDAEYLKFRRMTRDPRNQERFLGQSLASRATEVSSLRHRSRALTRLKPDDIMDVTPDAVVDSLREHGVTRLIHGHTHRPGIHEVDVDGRAATRTVLGDWYTHDSVLVWSAEEYRLTRVAELPNLG